MPVLCLLLILLVVLYAMGRFALGKGTTAWSFLRVFGFFLAIMVGNIIILAFVVAILLFIMAAVGSVVFAFNPNLERSADAILDTLLSDNVQATASLSVGKFPTVQWLLALLIIIFIVALVHAWIRRGLLQKFQILRMTETEYEISEYFIQWATIYIVIYQLFFDALHSVTTLLPELTSWQSAFEVILSPTNLNAVSQPLLIATWVTIVLERLAIAHQHADRISTLVHEPRVARQFTKPKSLVHGRKKTRKPIHRVTQPTVSHAQPHNTDTSSNTKPSQASATH